MPIGVLIFLTASVASGQKLKGVGKFKCVIEVLLDAVEKKRFDKAKMRKNADAYHAPIMDRFVVRPARSED